MIQETCKEFTSGLNQQQQEAVQYNSGPLMILAGAGSGKTRTLVSKVSYLLDSLKMSPFKLLALTFSNKAAREMRERVALTCGVPQGALQVTTFHSFCSRVLRHEADYLGLSKNFSIYDQGESMAIVKTIMGRYGISPKEISPYEILYYIEDLKNKGHYLGKTTSEIDETDPFYGYYTDYEQELHKANAFDFGGLITGTLNLFEKNTSIREAYQRRYEYIMVDEYQDTNRAQFLLLLLLLGEKRNLCVVGDEDQSIYSWRGADIGNILDFEKVFPEVRVLRLEQNYRSSKNIIEAASAVIARNIMRKGKELWTENPIGDSVQVCECGSERDEANFVSEEISSLIQNGESANDMAIFYRANSQSRVIEDALRERKINYRVVGGIKFYDRKEVKDVLSYLRLIVNPKDALSLARVINVPARGLGATSLKKLEKIAVDENCSLWEALVAVVERKDNYAHIRLSAKVYSSLNFFIGLISELRSLSDAGESPFKIFERVIYDSGYWDSLRAAKDYESMARLENIEELGSAIKQNESSSENASLLNFLETIALDNTQIGNEEEEMKPLSQVSLMTVHGSKGLEFPFVFIVGAEENVFPSYKSLEGGETGIEEERRLFYVAMTRAMKKLYLCFARARMLFGQLRFNGPSRFLNEIPSKYYSWKFYKTERFEDNSSDDYSQLDPYSSQESYIIKSSHKQSSSKFKKGEKVNHAVYGAGKVVETDGYGVDEKVLIVFSNGCKKRFLVKFAPLCSLS